MGLTFALTLNSLMRDRVVINVHDRRWRRENDQIVWKSEDRGNRRRQQVVTLQSRQFTKLPSDVQQALFDDKDNWSEMWPAGPDSPPELGNPRNIRIETIEDELLKVAFSKGIGLRPGQFDFRADISHEHVLAICEGQNSPTREFYIQKFGTPNGEIYSLDGQHLEDVVLGLKVESRLPDALAVVLTISQNRFLLNSLRGHGFLNMRLTADEAREVIGIDPEKQKSDDCIQSRPCIMTREKEGRHVVYRCSTHQLIFKPAIDENSFLWPRIISGLKLFNVNESDLKAVTAFRLSMVHRPRFTAMILPTTDQTPGTFACLLGDAANALHFWPGRGLNCGIASAVSLARCLSSAWSGRHLREADFSRHEAAMHMLQYRHKTRAWQAMFNVHEDRQISAVADDISEALSSKGDPSSDYADIFARRMIDARNRLAGRCPSDLPDERAIRRLVESADPQLLKVLIASEPWPTRAVGGEEVDIDLFFPQKVPAEPSIHAPTLDVDTERKSRFGLIILLVALIVGAILFFLYLSTGIVPR